MTKSTKWTGIVLVFLILVTAAAAQKFKTLTGFTEGKDPLSALVQGLDGNLYGTTSQGQGGCGTVFKVTLLGVLTTLHVFSGDDGCNPNTLVLADDGNFYGTTTNGGANGYGVVYKITPSGKLTTIYTFGGDGKQPSPWLILASDGNFYGTTVYGGTHGFGTIFQITREGVLTMLYSFTGKLDGANPFGGVIEATNGSLYGTTTDPFDGGGGTTFRIMRNGELQTLDTFILVFGPVHPGVPFLQASDGYLVGVTDQGGANHSGTIFDMTPEGEVQTLFSFCFLCPMGSYPESPLIQGTDGLLYGTTFGGGSEFGGGTLFQYGVDPKRGVKTLYSFCQQENCPDGENPHGALLQATNGIFYGTTSFAGPGSNGTVFSLDMGLGPFVTFVRFAGKVGETGPILGQGFTGATSVSINGIEANFMVISDTHIRATVPEGATTGYVVVDTPSGKLTSNVPFHVIQ